MLLIIHFSVTDMYFFRILFLSLCNYFFYHWWWTNIFITAAAACLSSNCCGFQSASGRIRRPHLLANFVRSNLWLLLFVDAVVADSIIDVVASAYRLANSISTRSRAEENNIPISSLSSQPPVRAFGLGGEVFLPHDAQPESHKPM